MLRSQYTDLSLDAMDSAGDQHLHIEHNIYKRRVDLSGNPIEEAKKEEIITSTTKKENIVSFFTFHELCHWPNLERTSFHIAHISTTEF